MKMDNNDERMLRLLLKAITPIETDEDILTPTEVQECKMWIARHLSANGTDTSVTYGAYCSDYDLTFVMRDVWRNGDTLLSTECLGWYHGTPNDADNEAFSEGRYKATYQDV